MIDARLIRIETLDESLIGFWYDRMDSTFKPAPIRVLADHSTDVVNYRNEDKWLSDVLDEKANSLTIYSKTESDARFALKGEGGSGTPGADGADGLSAYEVAVANGFIGNEVEWLESLMGEPGLPGMARTASTALAVSRGFLVRMVCPVPKACLVKTALLVRMDFLVEMANAVRRAIRVPMVAMARMAEMVRTARISAVL